MNVIRMWVEGEPDVYYTLDGEWVTDKSLAAVFRTPEQVNWATGFIAGVRAFAVSSTIVLDTCKERIVK